MKSRGCSETSIHFYRTTRHHIFNVPTILDPTPVHVVDKLAQASGSSREHFGFSLSVSFHHYPLLTESHLPSTLCNLAAASVVKKKRLSLLSDLFLFLPFLLNFQSRSEQLHTHTATSSVVCQGNNSSQVLLAAR
jgi:hypothetical protein